MNVHIDTLSFNAFRAVLQAIKVDESTNLDCDADGKLSAHITAISSAYCDRSLKDTLRLLSECPDGEIQCKSYTQPIGLIQSTEIALYHVLYKRIMTYLKAHAEAGFPPQDPPDVEPNTTFQQIWLGTKSVRLVIVDERPTPYRRKVQEGIAWDWQSTTLCGEIYQEDPRNLTELAQGGPTCIKPYRAYTADPDGIVGQIERLFHRGEIELYDEDDREFFCSLSTVPGATLEIDRRHSGES